MTTLIDLCSDTGTRPSAGMRGFMAEAPVGDEQRQEDPSVNALQDRVAALLGKEAALYLPSATMANEIAVKTHTQSGDAVILEESAHIATAEASGPALLSGVMLHAVKGTRGVFTPDQVEARFQADNPHYPSTCLLTVAHKATLEAGTVSPLDRSRAVADPDHR